MNWLKKSTSNDMKNDFDGECNKSYLMPFLKHFPNFIEKGSEGYKADLQERINSDFPVILRFFSIRLVSIGVSGSMSPD